MVGLKDISMHAHMQPPWGAHQEAPRGSWRWLAQVWVLAHPRCGRTQGEPPRHCLPHGGLLLGQEHSNAGGWPRLDG
jgi:hypothetical protein